MYKVPKLILKNKLYIDKSSFYLRLHYIITMPRGKY